MNTPKEKSLNKLLDSLHERITVCKERIYLKTWELSKKETSKTLFELQCKYHRECYDEATNKTTIGRLRASLNHENFERVSNTCITPATSKRVTRSSLDYFYKKKYFFCRLDRTRSLIHLGTFYRSDMMKRAINIANNDVLTSNPLKFGFRCTCWRCAISFVMHGHKC